ncbi:MAG: GDSL family lipase [Clostridia bacterium]|nr:GDSL family lipase [Clostridia bacterium]
MDLIEKFSAKDKNIYGEKPITIAFLGDSGTQGCFECYMKNEQNIETVFDYKSAYSTRFRELFNLLYPSVQLNIINSGISGDTAKRGKERVERDILAYNPDAVVVSYGLNDASLWDMDGVSEYAENLREIFKKSKQDGAEVIYLTEWTACDRLSPHLKDEPLKEIAKKMIKREQEGVLRKYFEIGKTVAKEENVKICDMYAVWEKMRSCGINTTELLANKINHPLREFHYYIAIKLLETIFEI